MEDVPERDLLPNNMMKVPEVYSLYCRSSYREGERGGDGEGEGEEGRGKVVRGEPGGGGGGGSIYSLYCHNVSLSL